MVDSKTHLETLILLTFQRLMLTKLLLCVDTYLIPTCMLAVMDSGLKEQLILDISSTREQIGIRHHNRSMSGTQFISVACTMCTGYMNYYSAFGGKLYQTNSAVTTNLFVLTTNHRSVYLSSGEKAW